MSRMPDDAFDAAVRGLHADSLQALSPRVRAQLAQRRRLALAGAPSPARARLGWATAAASALVLVVALQVRPPLHPPAGDAALTAAPVRETPADTGGLLAEDPDLYLWLASGEAQALAME